MAVITPDGAASGATLDSDLQSGARAIGVAVAPRLRDMTPAIRPAADGGVEPEFLLESMTLDPEDPADPVTMVACLSAHDAYVAARKRPGAVSPGALALARILVWATRAEMLGAHPQILWLGPPSRLPDDIHGYVVRASVRLTSGATTARAEAVAVIRRG